MPENGRSSCCVLAFFAASAVLCGAVRAADLYAFDFNCAGSPTQPGWLKVSSTNKFDTGREILVAPGVTAGFTGSIDCRDRGTANCPTNLVEGLHNQLFRDYVGPLGAHVFFDVRGLPPGTYTVWVIGGDPQWGAQHAPFNVAVNGEDKEHPGYPGSVHAPQSERDAITTIFENTRPGDRNVTVRWSITIAAGENIRVENVSSGGDHIRIAGVMVERAGSEGTVLTVR
jgi:hypothetical protein